MNELSPITEAILNAVTLQRWDVPYYAAPASIEQIASDASAVLWALANHQRSAWNGEGPLCHWTPTPHTRRELLNMLEELKAFMAQP